ncbi:MAG: hypothetical protein HYY24_27770 [Verrucomicrobia bacterium]|nr:hypothetical protein [Verrucomicrobiota bacterium]
MHITTKLTLAVTALALSSALAALAEGPVRNQDGFLIADWIVDADGNPLDDPSDLVYDLDGACPGEPSALVLKPNGQPLTFGEFTQASGRASAKCTTPGTHVVIKASGLIPMGVYTVWLLTFDGSGNFIGEGSLGAPDGSQNAFTASASGRAALSVIQKAGPLSEFGEVTNCLFDEGSWLLAIVYHPDGKTYGPTPGPLAVPGDLSTVQYCYFIEHLGFEFVQ